MSTRRLVAALGTLAAAAAGAAPAPGEGLRPAARRLARRPPRRLAALVHAGRHRRHLRGGAGRDGLDLRRATGRGHRRSSAAARAGPSACWSWRDRRHRPGRRRQPLHPTLQDINKVFWNFDEVEQRPDAVRIEVNAHQWAWDARYAGPDGKFNTKDDIVTLNDIRVPVDTPVLLQLASTDVIHSFYLPNFRVKQDAVPGHDQPPLVPGQSRRASSTSAAPSTAASTTTR